MNREIIGSATPVTEPSQIPSIGVGILGYDFMGKAHSNAFKTIPYMMYPPPAQPELIAICGRNAAAVSRAARRYGYAHHYTDWRKMLDAESKNIRVFDNAGPNSIHAEPCITAAQMGLHLFCEKPMAVSAAQAHAMLDAATRANVTHMVGFNYRFVPAIRQARELIARGDLGRIYHFRAAYLQEWLMPHYNAAWEWHTDKQIAGSGALGDLGSHIVDLARLLVGEITSVGAITRTFIPERRLPDGSGMAQVDVDDAFAAVVEFANGAMGTLEATRFAGGNKNHQALEINGEKGSIRFNLERLNELEVYWVGENPKETRGFHNVLMTESTHPWLRNWWPPGHILGWEHTFIHEFAHFFDCIVHAKSVAPDGATFEDGYRAAVICDAILESARTRRQVDIKYD